MISKLERLVALLDRHDEFAVSLNDESQTSWESLFEERSLVERQLLRAAIRSDTDAVAKVRYLARIAGDGERSDELDVDALRGLALWMEKRFAAAPATRQVA